MMKMRSLLRNLMKSTVAIVLATGMVVSSEASNKVQTFHSVNPPVIDASGGPDAFGYRWIDNNNEPTGPTYNWVDISTSGTAITFASTDDGISAPITIGFGFPFYGTNRTQLVVCTNGWVSFNTTETSTEYTNVGIPNAAVPNDIACPFWDDLISTNVRYATVDGNFVVSWIGSTRWNDTGSNLTFQVILMPDGSILYQYNTTSGTVNSGTIGVENGTGTVGLQVAFDAAYIAVGRAVRIYAQAATNILYGTVTANTGGTPIDSVNIQCGVRTGRTNAQGYYRFLVDAGAQTVTATKAGWNGYTGQVNITGDSLMHNFTMRRPMAVVSPTSLDLTVGIGDSVFGNVTLNNNGDGPMAFTAALQQGPVMDNASTREITPATDDAMITATTIPAIDEVNTPWQILRDIQIENLGSRRAQNYGAEYANGFIWAPCGDRWFRFTPEGTFVDSTLMIPGASSGAFTIRDMAFDGDYIYGSWDATLRAFDPTTGAAVTAANINCTAVGVGLCRAVAYDPNEDVFFVSNWGTVSSIYKVNRSGIVLQTYTNHGGVGGMAWYPADVDNKPLYIYTQGTGYNTRIYKMNPTTGDTSMVQAALPGAATADISASCFISDQVVPGFWVFGGMVQGAPDHLVICELANAGPRRWSFSPNQGNVAAGMNTPIQIGFRSVPTDNPRIFTATLNVTTNATDEVFNVPVEVTVQQVNAGEGNVPLANSFALLGAYPNPFNPTTSVKFSLATHSKVTLSLYDVSGREVASLLNAELPAGSHSIGMKAVDLAAGTYFIQMKAGSYVGATKVVLLK
ncbi:MAG: T9SS type A sorting domain-containing protein [bacterium]|nr:T9SS type A sorting domain-containing protein [bacterium]